MVAAVEAELLEAIAPQVLRLARRLAPSIAEDAAQAAMVALVQQLRLLDHTRPAAVQRAWLMRVASNAIYDESRRFRRQSVAAPLEDPGLLAAPAPAAHPPLPGRGTVLYEYLLHIRQTGSMRSAHSALARRHHRPVSAQTALFHRAARRWAAANGMAAAKRFSFIVAAVMAGKAS
jgi:DNA-directed RNA polymerase specialized sigma24 family protein